MPSALRDPRVVITAACLIAVVTFGARAGFGLFLEPISSTHGWGREIFAVSIGIQNIMWGIGQPIAGALADRFGTRRVLIVGAVVYFLGFLLMSWSTTPAMLHISAGFLIGVGGAGASFALVMAAVSRMVSDERRSWALGLIVASSSLGQVLLVPLGQAFIDLYGWMTALVLIGFLVLAVLPLSLPFDDRTKGAGIAAQTLGQALKEAMGHRSYLLLVAGFFVCGYHVAFIQIHLPAFIVDAGIEARIGAYAIALVGLFNIVGAYTAGVLGGRRSKKNLLALIYTARAIVIAAYVSLPISETSTLVFAAFMGLLWLSTVPLTSGLVAVMFGPRYMATLFGIVFLSHQLGAFLGAWLGGWAFDTFGSYTAVWWLGVGLGLAAALVHLPISERPVARLQPAAE
jgi:predicted MFS family arabinose efflux permease